jgi:hypothetical protein
VAEAPGSPEGGEGRPVAVARPLRDSDSRSRSWGYVGIVGLVLVAAAALLVGPNLLKPAATPPPSAAPSLEAHVLATAFGTFGIAIDYQAQAFVVSRLDSGPVALGGAVVSLDAPPLQTDAPLSGAWAWTMTCPGATAGEPIRMVFGALAPAANPQYLGPPASWSVASDGLFLIVLNAGAVDPGAEVRLSTRSASIGIDMSSFDSTTASGTPEPSGCRVS